MRDHPSEFLNLNHTELYQVCLRAELNPQLHMTKQELVDLLEGDPHPTKNPINEYREGIYHFIDQHWEVLQSQVNCPAKVHHISGCFGCVDAQVLACVLSNPKMDQFIQLRRKKS